MKRDKIKYPRVKIIKPWFWKECRFCYRGFKWEEGYRIADYTEVNPTLHYSYCCNKCANSIDDVINLVKDSKLKLPPVPSKESI